MKGSHVAVSVRNVRAVHTRKLHTVEEITALQELNELVQNNKVDDVVAMLPNWTYFYKILTVDPDRKVRELTQVCHGTIVGICGRQVAPQLKALLPSWLAAQHDEHAPARSRAQLTLRSTFPENKLPDAISFCKTEILTHMVDNILDSSATVSKKLENEEERVAAATRVSCGALGGLRYFIQYLPSTHDEWLWTELAGLLKANAFWKLAGHSAPEVRTAWYNAIGALAERFGPQWGSTHGVRTMKLLLQVRETGGTAHALWAALLSNLIADPEWYTRLDKKELLTKRILESLECGGWGSARAMCEALPRLLELLPAAVLTTDFCTALFDACFAGLEKRNIISSKSERGAWIAGIGECVRVLAERTDVPTEVVPGALGRWLRAVFGNSALDVKAALVASLEPMLCSWASTPRLELLLRAFWQNVSCTVSAQLKQLGPHVDDDKLKSLVDAHTLLLVTLYEGLHDGLREKPKKKKGVTFSDDNDRPEDTEIPTPPTEVNKNELEATLLLRHQLSDCIQRVCAQYVEFARDVGKVEVVLKGLMPVLELTGTKEVWTAMGGALTNGSATPYALWEHGLYSWLSKEQTRCEAAVQVTFLLLPHLSEEQLAAVFTAFEKLDAPFADWALPRSVHSQYACARAWVRSASARAALLRAARSAIAGDDKARDTLTTCLTPDASGEIPASTETISEVLQLVSYVIQSGSSPNSSVVKLSARLVKSLGHRAAAGIDDILVALFRHDLYHSNDSTEAGEQDSDTRVAWREGVRALPMDKQKPLVERLGKLLREYINTDSTDLETSRIHRCAYLSAALANASSDGGIMLTELLLEGDDCTTALVPALRLDIVAGRMNCPFDDVELVRAVISESPELTVSTFLPTARLCVLRAAWLARLAESSPRSPLECDNQLRVFLELLHRHAIVRALKQGYAFSPVYDLITSTDQQLSSLISEITSLTPEHILHNVYSQLAKKAAANGLYWAYAAVLCRVPENKEDYSQILTGDGLFHGLQLAKKAAANGLYWAYAAVQCKVPENKEDYSQILTGDGLFHGLQLAKKAAANGLYWAYAAVLCKMPESKADYSQILTGDGLFHGLQQLSSLISEITTLTPEHILHKVYSQLAKKAAANGLYWAYAAVLCKVPENKEDYSQILTGDGLFHGLQQLSSLISEITSLTPEHILHNVYEQLAKKAAANGLYWAYAAVLCKVPENKEDYSQILTGDGLFHGLQLAKKAAANGLYWAYAAVLCRVPENKEDYSQILTGDGLFHGLQAQMSLKPSDPCEERLHAAHAVMLRALRAAHEKNDAELGNIAPDAPPTADVVVDAYYRREKSMLYDT
ncbi:hypothetical protein NE865_13386 [Phthorimaea operculella]|nr:hypothetical protein NE865_13386 [Phthorimaea operculella]